MGKKRTKKELQTVETFLGALWEETSISSEFDLPLAVLAASVEGGWREGTLRRTLDGLRIADLVALPEPSQLLVVLPNTGAADARVVEERIRKTVPEATLGVAVYERGDAAEDLLKRAAPRLVEGPETL